jgi:hypothetical protein
MGLTRVYPLKQWDQMAGNYRLFTDRFATLEKIAQTSCEPYSEKAIEVDDDRVFDGWYIESEYKGHRFHVVKDEGGFVIFIYGSDGKPARRTANFVSALEALHEARLIVDRPR